MSRPVGAAGLVGCVCAALLGVPAYASVDDPHLRKLTEDARALRLAQRPQWHALLHYAPTLGGGFESEADDPRFFLSERGKRDPVAELEATLAAFFSPQPVHERGEPAQCAFIARYRWLRGELDFDAARLREHRCERFEAWYRAVDPHALTLVFPADYLNNPSSMFGHTLLRVDPAGDAAETPLLSYAINYGAVTGDDGGVFFAVKGLTGGYTGLFSIAPYYEKVREYSDLENRDIWEYALRVTPAEVQILIGHLWELRGVGFDYYFFTENCSYQLLTLLDVARPSLQLARQFDAWVIPADTVRVLREEGLLGTATYRPAASTRLAQDAARLPDADRQLARQLAEQPGEPGSPGGAAGAGATPREVVELAYDYLHYERLAGRAEGPDRAQRLHELLQARAQLGAVSPVRTYARPAMRPDEGHPTAMLSAGVGVQSPDTFLSVRFRPAFHDRLDPSGGYKNGAEIAFFDMRLRHFPTDDRLVVERFGVVDILSLSPRDRLFRPWSWGVRAVWDRRPLPAGAAGDELTFAIEGGAGIARRLGDEVLGYAFLDMNVEVNDDFADGYALGPGIRVGTVIPLAARWKLGATARYAGYAGGQRFERRDLALELRRTLDRRNQLELVLMRQQADAQTRRDRYLTWRHYF